MVQANCGLILCTAADHQHLTASVCHLIGSPDRHHLQRILHKLALHSVSKTACSIHTSCSSGTDAVRLGAPDSTASCRNSLGQHIKQSLEHVCLCLGQHSPCSRAPGTQQHCRKLAVSGIQSTQSNAHHQRHIQPVSHHHLLTLHPPLLQAQTHLSILCTTKSSQCSKQCTNQHYLPRRTRSWLHKTYSVIQRSP